eukprot:TRINITY_DN1781_c0_g1_i1.p1 TRINITY_DN1781_c0_g1~~TRINITY_DN1781_c0_g1_i1.p1  ORF type:complete len:317 (+),score=117.98 TRINITY_DN1781_c0_g1_i1:945-1895(+)
MTSSMRNDCEVLHGDIAQHQREITLTGFREGRFSCLVATDVAARGLDITGVDLIVQCQPPRDTETYIHRSGRTGRAGRQGTVITFYNKNEAGMIKRLEKSSGVDLQRIGNPQPQDIVAAAAKSSVDILDQVDPEIITFFESAAKQLIEEKGEARALAAALAFISGQTKRFTKRSLLSSIEDHTTILFTSQSPIFSPVFVINVIKRYLDEGSLKSIKEIALTKDGCGAVLDVPNSLVKNLVEEEAALEVEEEVALEVEAHVPFLFNLISGLMCGARKKERKKNKQQANVNQIRGYFKNLLLNPVSYTHLTLPTICSV